MLVFSKKDLELNKARTKEWVITNGLGSYASSTIINLNTRRYHGLLVASLNFPVKRILTLAKLEENLIINDKVYSLGVNQYPGTIHPEGYKYLKSFVFNIFPSFNYNIKDVEITKSIVLPHNHNVIIVRYLINTKREFTFKIRPFVNFRNFHSLNYEAKNKFKQTANESSTVIIPVNENAAIILGSDSGKYKQNEFWVYNIEYQEERERGYDFREHHFSPGEFTFNVKKGTSSINIVCTANNKEDAYIDFENFYSKKAEDYKQIFENELLRVNTMVSKFYENKKIEKEILINNLIQAADSFIVKRENLRSIMSGYHWFSDYGRDALISLPGLCLVNGKIQDAKEILLFYKKYIKNGLIPKLINENNIAEYNSVDTSLWFIYSVYKFYQYTKNLDFIKDNLWKEMKSIIYYYKNGTEYHIKADKDGLIEFRSSLSLTWMDTKYNLREGKCVEVNALWYNCLKIMEFFAYKFEENNLDYVILAKKVKKSFNKFWLGKYLADNINGENKDISVRPNQIFVLSLPFRLLTREKELLVLKKVTDELLTPFGLRSLSKNDSKYIGKYYGSAIERDRSYHNGTIWGWLLGPYLSSYLRLHNYSSLAKKEAKEKILKYISISMKEYGIGTINEIYDGDFPYTARGCISQAWSVAEILRSYVEDVSKS